MNLNRFLFPTFVIMLFLMVSCTANLEIRKKQEEASRELGEAYMVQGNYTLALKELLKAEELYSNDAYLHNDLGLVYGAKKRFDLAINHFKKAIKMKPDYAPAMNNLGTIYLAKEDWDAAIKCFKEITGDLLYATPHYPVSNLGMAYYNKKAYQLAEKYYLDALKIEPDFVIALRGLGKTYVAMGKVQKALKTFEKAVKKAPSFPQLYLDMARAYVLTGNYTRALHAYEKVLELAPDTPMTVEAKEEMAKLDGLERETQPRYDK